MHGHRMGRAPHPGDVRRHDGGTAVRESTHFTARGARFSASIAEPAGHGTTPHLTEWLQLATDGIPMNVATTLEKELAPSRRGRRLPSDFCSRRSAEAPSLASSAIASSAMRVLRRYPAALRTLLAGFVLALATGAPVMPAQAEVRCGVDVSDYPPGPPIWPDEPIKVDERGEAKFRVVLNVPPGRHGDAIELAHWHSVPLGPDRAWASACVRFSPEADGAWMNTYWNNANWNIPQTITVKIGDRFYGTEECIKGITKSRFTRRVAGGIDGGVNMNRRKQTIRTWISGAETGAVHPSRCPVNIEFTKATTPAPVRPSNPSETPAAQLTIDNVTVNEGDDVTFTVVLQSQKLDSNGNLVPLGASHTVSYTADRKPSGHTGLKSGTLTFPGTERLERRTITYHSATDNTPGEEETFNVTLTPSDDLAPQLSKSSDLEGRGTIVDPASILSISDEHGWEGDDLTFSVGLIGGDGPISIPLTTDGEGVTLSPSTVSFAGTHAEEYKKIRASTTENTLTDGERTFKVTLDIARARRTNSQVEALAFDSASDTEGTGRILDDDPARAHRGIVLRATNMVVYEHKESMGWYRDFPVRRGGVGKHYFIRLATRPPDPPGLVKITPVVSDPDVLAVEPETIYFDADADRWRHGLLALVYPLNDGIANTDDRTVTVTFDVEGYGLPDDYVVPSMTVTVKQLDHDRVDNAGNPDPDPALIRPGDAAFYLYHRHSPSAAEQKRYDDAVEAIEAANIRYATRRTAAWTNVFNHTGISGTSIRAFNMPRFFLRDPEATGWTGKPEENNSSSVQWVRTELGKLTGNDDDGNDDSGTTGTQGSSAPGVLPAATLLAVDPDSAVTEGGAVEFRVRLARPAPRGGTTVKVMVIDAAPGDFIASEHEGEHQVQVPAGRSNATLRIETVADDADEQDGTVTAVLVEGEGYRVGSPSSAEAAVSDDDDPPPPVLPRATLMDVAGHRVSEGRTLTVGVMLTAPAPEGGLDVALTVTEAAGHDYLSSDNEGSQTVSVPAGSTVAPYYLRTEMDDVYRSDGTVTIAIADGTGYTAGSPSSALVTVEDDDDPSSAPVVPGTWVAAGPSPVTEGGEASFTVTLTTPAPSDGREVALTVSEPEGSDVVALADEGPDTLSFAAGETSKTYTVATQADGDAEPSGTVTVTLDSGTGYTVGSPSSATVTVNDDDGPPAFEASSYSFDLEENANGATTAVALGTVSATAAATGGTVSYSIAAGDTHGKFAIGGSDGALTYTAEGENHEDFSDPSAAFTLTVRASDGTAHGDVTVTVGVSDVAEPPGKPEAPSVAATADSTTGLDVSWGAPSNTGPDITGYDVRYRVGSSGDFIDGPQDVTGTSTALTDLAPGTTYEVQVRATNDEGDGDWSDPGSGTTSAAPAEPARFAVYHDASDPQATARYDEGIRALDAASLSYVVRSATRAQVSTLAGVSSSVMPRFFFGDPTAPGWTSQPKVNNGGLQWLKGKVAELIDEDSQATNPDAASAQALFRLRVYHDAGDAAAVERFDTAMAELAAAGIEPEVIEATADGTPARLAGHTRVRLPRFFVGEPEASGRYPDERNGGPAMAAGVACEARRAVGGRRPGHGRRWCDARLHGDAGHRRHASPGCGLHDRRRHGDGGRGLHRDIGNARLRGGRDDEDGLGAGARRCARRGRGDADADALERRWRAHRRRRGDGHHREHRPASAGVARAVRAHGRGPDDRGTGRALRHGCGHALAPDHRRPAPRLHGRTAAAGARPLEGRRVE